MSQISSIDETYKSAHKLLLDIRHDLELIETEQDTTIQVQGRLGSNINNLSRKTVSLDSLVSKQPPNKKELWRIKVQQLKDECKSLRRSIENYYQAEHIKQKENLQRVERRNAATAQRQNNIDGLIQENSMIKNAQSKVSDLEESGFAIIDALAKQNESLKNARQKIWDLGSDIKIARSVIRLIEKRQQGDKMLVYLGMIITSFFFILLYYMFRW